MQLNTISNLGGTWPKWFVIQAVDYFTASECHAAVVLNGQRVLDLPVGLSCNQEAVCVGVNG
jgi:PAT family acetyl-CoA transporter-like MFS transporter 1